MDHAGLNDRATRDTVILIVAILWGTFEIVFGGARPPVIILVGAMMIAGGAG